MFRPPSAGWSAKHPVLKPLPAVVAFEGPDNASAFSGGKKAGADLRGRSRQADAGNHGKLWQALVLVLPSAARLASRGSGGEKSPSGRKHDRKKGSTFTMYLPLKYSDDGCAPDPGASPDTRPDAAGRRANQERVDRTTA